mmetsp:Transcript_27459/g.65278  ORF Transcript_27459/g.65278 Transcript_27459/m.65278 type:complete len:257 (+) Transcript_27459:346-1116(+)
MPIFMFIFQLCPVTLPLNTTDTRLSCRLMHNAYTTSFGCLSPNQAISMPDSIKLLSRLPSRKNRGSSNVSLMMSSILFSLSSVRFFLCFSIPNKFMRLARLSLNHEKDMGNPPKPSLPSSARLSAPVNISLKLWRLAGAADLGRFRLPNLLKLQRRTDIWTMSIARFQRRLATLRRSSLMVLSMTLSISFRRDSTTHFLNCAITSISASSIVEKPPFFSSSSITTRTTYPALFVLSSICNLEERLNRPTSDVSMDW